MLFRRYVLPSAAFLIALAILCALGVWQLQRMAWKEALIARIEARFDRLPVALPAAPEWTAPDFLTDFEYQPVSVTGRFEPEGSDPAPFQRFYTYTLLSDPRGPRGGQGYWVLNLFHPVTGGTVYVNRGFVPSPGTETPPPAGEVTLTGVVRTPSTGNSFTPPCEVEVGVCYVADVHRAAGFAGVTDVAPFYIDLRVGGVAGAASDGAGLSPQAGETRIAFPNNHLQYAITWFGLAAALTGVFAAFMAGEVRRDRT